MAEIEQGEWAAGPSSGRVLAFDRLRRDDAGARLLTLVAEATNVPVPLLMHKSRCKAEIAQARQLAMYLMHVVLQRNFAAVGDFFGRDRTTVSHACATIEDRRDRKSFEALVAQLEARLRGESEDDVGTGGWHVAG
ncbi:MAG TPA: hypothetical protein GYA10_09405 [Alphaproteobacteria bacterium]|nr:hypothetical protein [Alphaproteobacteria bacterium]